MPWHPVRTWATGEYWTAALVNEQLRDNMIALTPVVGEYKLFARAATSTETVIGVNYLECNGRAVSRSNYDDLYSLFNGMRQARGWGSTTLSAAMTSSQTTLTIATYPPTWPGGTGTWEAYMAHFGREVPFLIQIDSEKLLVTSVGNWPLTTFTVSRAREGTTAASHSSGATVSLSYDLPFGSGDGLTTFNLPDLHGRAPWSMSRPGGNIDVSSIGRNDRTADLSYRRPKHRHAWDLGASGQQGGQVPFAAGTLGAGEYRWMSPGGHAYGTFGINVGPMDGDGYTQGRTSLVPNDGPAYLVAGVWGIRFVG